MQRVLLSLLILIGVSLSGLLIASVLLQEECPDCAGQSLYIAENPLQFDAGPVVLDCRRCGGRGRVSRLDARLGPAPDPLLVRLLYQTNRTFWGDECAAFSQNLAARLRASPLKTASGKDWECPPMMCFEQSRYVHQEGRTYLLLLMNGGSVPGYPRSALLYLFDRQGTLVDAVLVAAFGGSVNPEASFVIPVGEDGCCGRVRLETRKSDPFSSIEIDHAGRLWKRPPERPADEDGFLEWSLKLQDGRLRITEDRTGNSIPE